MHPNGFEPAFTVLGLFRSTRLSIGQRSLDNLLVTLRVLNRSDKLRHADAQTCGELGQGVEANRLHATLYAADECPMQPAFLAELVLVQAQGRTAFGYDVTKKRL